MINPTLAVWVKLPPVAAMGIVYNKPFSKSGSCDSLSMRMVCPLVGVKEVGGGGAGPYLQGKAIVNPSLC